MDPNNNLRIATRIHFALLRHYGEDVPVGDLLKSEATAREALWVCAASGIDELTTLGQQLVAAHAEQAEAARRRRVVAAPQRRAALAEAIAATPQDLSWAKNTSGFGVSRFSANPSAGFLADPPASNIPDWLKPSTWLRRSNAS